MKILSSSCKGHHISAPLRLNLDTLEIF